MIINYYPNYSHLDNMVYHLIDGKSNVINLFIDLKNCMQTLYMKSNAEILVENTKRDRRIDSTITSDFLNFLIFHKIYALKRNKNIRFFIFFEIGESIYHINIFKNYKLRRKIDKFPFLDADGKQILTSVLQKNLQLIKTICEKLPNIWVFCLENLEADFIPYYLIRNNLIDNGNDFINIVYSNDHDLFQTLNLSENIFQMVKTRGKIEILKRGDAINKLLGRNSNISDDFFPLLLALLGDSGDDIPGIPGVGKVRVINILETLISTGISMEEIFDNIFQKGLIGIDIAKICEKNKIKYNIDEKILVRNLKLISFELIRRYLDDPPNTEFIERRRTIESMIRRKKYTKLEVLESALSRSQIFIENLQCLYEEV